MVSLPFKSSPSYGRLSQLENDGEIKEQPSQSSKSLISIRAWLIHGILLLVSISFFIFSLFNYRIAHIAGTDIDAAKWSKDLSSIPQITTKFRGSFLAPSKYRGSSASANKAWDRFTLSRYVDGTAVILGVTEEDIRKSNKLQDEDWFNTTAVLEEGEGKDETRYMATLEIFHQVHCLDMIRKATFGDTFKDDFAWKHGSEQLRNHLDHCIEIIRQVVMCNSDPRLITFHWVKDNPVPYPDFNTWHQCRDVDATVEWAEKNAWPLDHAILKKGEVVEMPEAP